MFYQCIAHAAGVEFNVGMLRGLSCSALIVVDRSISCGYLFPSQQLLSNPEMLQQMLDSPMMQGILNNPETFQSMLTNNPQMQQLMEVCLLCPPVLSKVDKGLHCV